jgi:transcription initiation factor TFIIA small subunit
MSIYRKTTLGDCLTDTLEELKNNNVLSEELAEKVLAQFDKSFAEALSARVKSKASFKV